jgi:hypothetical protein
MAHFKLKSVDISGMFGGEPGTYEYICIKEGREKSYRRLSGPMGGFDVFNLKCLTKEDYKRADWIIQELNKKYEKTDKPSESKISEDIVNLYGNYKRVKQMIKELKLGNSLMPESI